MSSRARPLFVFCLLAAVSLIALSVLRTDAGAIFHQELFGWDEHVNAVVAANAVRGPFPPKVRLNPLVDAYQGWSEGPEWMHIPPLFAYVSAPVFTLDGRVSIEGKRLAFWFLAWLTALLFVAVIARFRGSSRSALAAALAAGLWLKSPFTRGLITGTEFGVSDLTLAFAVVVALGATLEYLRRPPPERRALAPGWLFLFGGAAALPLIAKHVLGAIPITSFGLLLLLDGRGLSRRVWAFAAGALAALTAFFLPLYLSSPSTFRLEMATPFAHVSNNYEGWQRPWHWFFTHYLREDYLGRAWLPFLVLLALAVLALATLRDLRSARTPVWVCIGWTVANYAAISFVKSKAPNFAFQSWLLLLYAMAELLLLATQRFLAPAARRVAELPNLTQERMTRGLAVLAVALSVPGVYGFARIPHLFAERRAHLPPPSGDRERMAEVGRALQTEGFGPRDLVLLHTSVEDLFFRYYVLFFTGAEARTWKEVADLHPSSADVRARYRRLTLIVSDPGLLPPGCAQRKLGSFWASTCEVGPLLGAAPPKLLAQTPRLAAFLASGS